ncbi:MAG: ferredoxin [Pseudomonadota bacterium]
MRIEIFPEKCIGVGQCVIAAPDLFEQNEDDGIVYLLRDNAPEERRDAAIAAARLCPTLAIVVHDD